MGISTPEQFARKLVRMSEAVVHQQDRALKARADVTKAFILGAAGREAPKQVRPGWVKVTTQGDVAALRLWGGMARIIESGSYHKPEGYTERPKRVTARRRANALKKGVTLNESGLMSTPYGPRPFVHHPFVRPRPFWQQGLARSRKPGHEAYRKVIDSTISDALK